MKAFFWNESEKRIRTLFRILIFLIVVSVPAVLISLAADGLTDLLEKSLMNFFVMIAFLLSIYVVGTYIDKRDWSEFGISLLPIKHFFQGALLGSILIIFIFSIQYALGWLSLKDFQFNKFSSYPFLLVFFGQIFRYLCGSVFEEAFSRGYLLKNIAEGLKGRLTKGQSVLIAYVVTSSMFGILHLANDNSSLLSTINLILIGFLFGWMVVKTGKLHFAIGLHAFWNIFQNNVFGFENSGKKSIVSLFTFENTGKTLWTGGDFGFEGGLLCAITVLLTLLIFMRSHFLGTSKFDQKILK